MVLGAVVRAEQRLAWAKVLTRLGAATRIQALFSTEHGRGLPRLVGELLLTASVSTAELVIARTEMQVCNHSAAQGFAVPRQLSTSLGQSVSALMSFRVATQVIQMGGRADDGDRSVFTGFSANRTGGLGNQELLNAETVRLADLRHISGRTRQI